MVLPDRNAQVSPPMSSVPGDKGFMLSFPSLGAMALIFPGISLLDLHVQDKGTRETQHAFDKLTFTSSSSSSVAWVWIPRQRQILFTEWANPSRNRMDELLHAIYPAFCGPLHSAVGLCICSFSARRAEYVTARNDR